MQLIARNISKSFGATHALDDVSITLESGKVHALVGENGAGKSTLFKVLAAHEKRDDGNVALDNQPFNPLNIIEAESQGVVMVLQEITISTAVGIAENIFLNRLREFTNPFGLLKRKELMNRAQKILDELGAGISVKQDLRSLDLGQWKIIEIARALSINPRVLFLDESTAYLNTREVTAFLNVIKNLRKKGMAIGFVSHHLNEVDEIADLVTILKDGKLVGNYHVGELMTEEMEALMVGREVGRDIYPYAGQPEVKGVWCANGGTATGVRAAIKRLGKRPGEDIKIVTMDLNPDNIEAIKRSEVVFDIGGHWMQGGFACLTMFDYLNGEKISPSDANVKLKLTPVTIDRIPDYEKGYPDNWPDYNFRKHSRFFNPSLATSYDNLVITTAQKLNQPINRFKIGAVVPTLEAIFWNRYYEFMQKAADELGVELIRLNANNKPELLEEHLKKLIEMKVDGIIFVPYWGSDLRCLEQTRQASIPVIFTDVYSENVHPQSPEYPNYIAFFGPADEEAGYQMAVHLIDAVSASPDGKKYIGAVTGTPGTTVANDRYKGLKRALEEHSEVVLVGNVDGNFVATQSETEFEKTSWSIREMGSEMLKFENITVPGKLSNIDLVVHCGEILGIGGLKGSGGESILETVIGILHPTSGQILYNSQPFSPKNPSDAWINDIAYLPGNRSSEGLIVEFTVMENLIMAAIPNRGPLYDHVQAREISENAIANLRIKAFNSSVPCSSLSGGNMQKVVLGKCINAYPKLLLLNNPTRGIDVGARIEIYRIINDLVKKGLSVMLLSEDLPELIGLSDRIMITRQGVISKTFSRDHWPTEDEIITHMI